MPLIPLRPLLEATVKYGFGQGAFNVNAVAQAKAAIEVHEMFRSAAILQGADLANGFMGGRCDFMNATLEDKKAGAKNIADAVKKYGADSKIPIVLHLDHGRDFDSCAAAIEGGYTSVMIDGSSLPFKENMELTREVVKYAHARGVSVEGELGVLAGVEDHVFSAASTYTNPLDAVEFFKNTEVDALAISYGTMHGASKGKNVKLRKEIAVAIRECMNHQGIFGALVSHGSSTVPKYIVDEINGLGGELSNTYGISIEELKAAIPCGISKIKHGTLSIGFIGLAESLVAMTGKHHGEDEESRELGLDIITHMRERCDEYAKKYKLNFSLLATPAEGIAGRFTKIDRKEYGEIPGVVDREYYTNSFHVPVYYPISAFEKIEIEAPYHALCNAGHITYIELDGDPSQNLDAFEAVIRKMKESGIGYGSVNHPVDRDPVCGFSGIIPGERCPSCGRIEGDVPFERLRRITGYLVGSLERWNDGKKAEERDRVKHNVNGVYNCEEKTAREVAKQSQENMTGKM